MNRIVHMLLPGFLICFASLSSFGEEASYRWWPTQAIPRGVVQTSKHEGMETVVSPNGKSTSGSLGAAHMLVQSVAGLAAQAVNEGQTDEMVWIGADNPDYEAWYKGLVQRLNLEERGTLSTWELVERFIKQDVIKGYILYSYDYSQGMIYEEREHIDESVNVATSLAGILKGILVEEGQEQQAIELGLPLLFDARGKTEQWCFENYKDRFSRTMLCTQDPKVPHNRALAIAHQSLVVYGLGEPMPSMLALIEPCSPILGWNQGDEFHQTLLISEYGHFQTATNWCLNLPILSAGTEHYSVRQVKSLDPSQIDWNDTRHAVSFIMSDGDNVQWLMGAFCRYREGSYWNSPDHGKFPFGWTSCSSQLVQLAPETWDCISDTQPEQVSLIEFGGGYYYPDHFGKKRPEKDLLARHARQVWANMQKAGVRILAVNCADLRSEEARNAFEVFAREMDGLLGILAIQYAPYEGGAGEIYWVQDTQGRDVPVVTAKYSIWGNANHLGPRIGTPAKVARVIHEEARQAAEEERRNLEWAIVHCWSYFQKAPGDDEEAENIDQDSRKEKVRGVTPVAWCVERLDSSVHVVSPDELLWRIRMEHRPEQTRNLLGLMELE